jgi:hypothetical protein
MRYSSASSPCCRLRRPGPAVGSRTATVSLRWSFMARTSTPWSLLPAKDLGCGSATTCWRRLDELGEAGRIDLERVSVDSFSLRAVKGGT